MSPPPAAAGSRREEALRPGALQRVKRQHQGRWDGRPTSNIDTLTANARPAVKTRSLPAAAGVRQTYLLSGLSGVSGSVRGVAVTAGFPPPHCTSMLNACWKLRLGNRRCGAPIEIPMICLRKLKCLMCGNTHMNVFCQNLFGSPAKLALCLWHTTETEALFDLSICFVCDMR